MEQTNLSKNTVSFGISLALVSVINGIVVVVKEKNPAVMAAMKKATSHHWITHSILVVALFLLVGWGLGLANGGKGVKLTAKNLLGTVLAGVLLGSLTIVGFYLFVD